MVDLNEIWKLQKSRSENIVLTRIDENSKIENYVGTNLLLDKIFYMMSVDATVKIPEMNQFHFRGLHVFVLQKDGKNNLYIDLIDTELDSIFIKFIEDVVLSVSITNSEYQALQETFRVILKWKRLFDKINFGGLGLESQKGLIGELLFFESLLDKGYEPMDIINSWTANEFKDKDFVVGSNGYEIKFTSAKKPVLRISSERQLDPRNLNSLTLVLYIAEEVMEDGVSLNSIISNISNRLKSDVLAFESFTKCLAGIGYSVEDAEHYTNMYKIKKSNFYKIDEGFPKIVSDNISSGINEVSYCIELSAAEPFLFDF